MTKAELITLIKREYSEALRDGLDHQAAFTAAIEEACYQVLTEKDNEPALPAGPEEHQDKRILP